MFVGSVVVTLLKLFVFFSFVAFGVTVSWGYPAGQWMLEYGTKGACTLVEMSAGGYCGVTLPEPDEYQQFALDTDRDKKQKRFKIFLTDRQVPFIRLDSRDKLESKKTSHHRPFVGPGRAEMEERESDFSATSEEGVDNSGLGEYDSGLSAAEALPGATVQDGEVPEDEVAAEDDTRNKFAIGKSFGGFAL